MPPGLTVETQDLRAAATDFDAASTSAGDIADEVKTTEDLSEGTIQAGLASMREVWGEVITVLGEDLILLSDFVEGAGGIYDAEEAALSSQLLPTRGAF